MSYNGHPPAWLQHSNFDRSGNGGRRRGRRGGGSEGRSGQTTQKAMVSNQNLYPFALDHAQAEGFVLFVHENDSWIIRGMWPKSQPPRVYCSLASEITAIARAYGFDSFFVPGPKSSATRLNAKHYLPGFRLSLMCLSSFMPSTGRERP